jgi:hypothetical protein
VTSSLPRAEHQDWDFASQSVRDFGENCCILHQLVNLFSLISRIMIMSGLAAWSS